MNAVVPSSQFVQGCKRRNFLDEIVETANYHLPSVRSEVAHTGTASGQKLLGKQFKLTNTSIMDCILHIIWRGRYLTEEYFKVLKFWINLGFFVCLLELYRRCSIWEPLQLECWKESVLFSKPLLHILLLQLTVAPQNPYGETFQYIFSIFNIFRYSFVEKDSTLRPIWRE